MYRQILINDIQRSYLLGEYTFWTYKFVWLCFFWQGETRERVERIFETETEQSWIEDQTTSSIYQRCYVFF